MTTPRQLYDKLPTYKYTNWDYNTLNSATGRNAYLGGGEWGGQRWKYRWDLRECPSNYSHAGFHEAYSDSYYRKCKKKPFENSSYYKDHKKAIDNLKKGSSSLLLELCDKERGKSKTSGYLFKGSTDCTEEMEKLCKKGVSFVPCDYLLKNKLNVYKNAMDGYCFGNNRDKNINKSVCRTYYKDNYNSHIGNKLRDFCATSHNGKPRYQDEQYLTICACHKPDSYYKNIKDSIRKKWGGPPGLDTHPKCIYDDCLASRLYDKKDECRKIDFTQCIQNVDFDVHGNLTNEGTIKIGQEANCGKDYSLKEEKPTPSKSSSSTSSSPSSTSMSKSEAENKLKEVQEKYNLQKDGPGIFDKLKSSDSKTKGLILLLLLFVVVIIGFVIQYFVSGADNLQESNNVNLQENI